MSDSTPPTYFEPIKLTTRQAKPIVSKAFPAYCGRKYRLVFTTTLRFANTNWGGGTRNEYVALRADGRMAAMPDYAPWEQWNWDGRAAEMPEDVLVIEHSWYQGEDVGVTVYAHPVHMPKWLSNGELSS